MRRISILAEDFIDPVGVIEAAHIIGCHPGNIYHLIQQGKLAARQVNGKCWLLDRSEVVDYERRAPNRRSRAEALSERQSVEGA